MSADKRKLNQSDDEDTDSHAGEGGSSTSGEIKYRDFMTTERLRDDLLSPEEKKRLLAVHDTIHAANVKNQKEKREARTALRAGIRSPAYQQGLREDAQSGTLHRHPILGDKAQFSGQDQQVNALPDENKADTNHDKREELRYQYQLQHQPEQAPTPVFNPKPIPK